MRTGRDAFYGEPDYIARGPGVTAEATRWLYEQGVRVMGIDAWGWDAPLHLQAEEAKAAGEPGIFWAAHQADLDYSQIERLVNLGELPPTGSRSPVSRCAWWVAAPPRAGSWRSSPTNRRAPEAPIMVGGFPSFQVGRPRRRQALRIASTAACGSART